MKKGEERTFVRDGMEVTVVHGVHYQRYFYGEAEFFGRILPNNDDRAGANYNVNYAMAFREYPDVMA